MQALTPIEDCRGPRSAVIRGMCTAYGHRLGARLQLEGVPSPYSVTVIAARHCSKPGCGRPAVATLTYDYADSTAVLGPLATTAEPHAYDLCDVHAEHLTAPIGWQVVRLQTSFDPAPPSPDDLLALVDAVREAAHADPVQPSHTPSRRGADRGPFATAVAEVSEDSPLDPESSYARRRAHFRVVADPED